MVIAGEAAVGADVAVVEKGVRAGGTAEGDFFGNEIIDDLGGFILFKRGKRYGRIEPAQGDAEGADGFSGEFFIVCVIGVVELAGGGEIRAITVMTAGEDEIGDLPHPAVRPIAVAPIG